jgi:hypothetical protein
MIQKEAASFFFPIYSHHSYRKLYVFVPLRPEVLPDVVDRGIAHSGQPPE